MKLPLALCWLTGCTLLVQAEAPKPGTVPPQLPPPAVSGAPVPAPAGEPIVYDQKPLAGQPLLVTPEQARGIIDRFRAGYEKLGNPRILIYVNRELVDEKSGMKLSGRTEKTESSRSRIESDMTLDPNAKTTGGTVNVTSTGNVTLNGNNGLGKGTLNATHDQVVNENKYNFQEKQSSLADRQTVRDVERLFGRPFRAAGAVLADQRTATQLMADRALKDPSVATEGEAARKDREALSKIADVALEILITSRSVVVNEVSGDKVYQVPDIQATAIRLSDSHIVGQVSATDVLGKDRYVGRTARNFDVRDIAEATALGLMEDILSSLK